ncbi:MAG: response regulator [Bacteroidetes bacterium]|nr:response regulator [Bacteroidota bacterium]
MQPQILLADDHSMIRKGLKLLLQLHLGFTDVSEVVSCNELMKELSRKKYTHLVLDIILSDGSTLEILPNIQRLYPDLQIMVFSMQPAGSIWKGLEAIRHRALPAQDDAGRRYDPAPSPFPAQRIVSPGNHKHALSQQSLLRPCPQGA